MGARVSGSIKLEGRELIGLPESALRQLRGRRIAAIFQSPSLAFNPVFRVGHIVLEALRLHGLSKGEATDRAAAAMREVLLPPDLLRRYPGQLSGGQLQRVAIALALALRASVLLADEPTSALDVTVQAEVLELLRDLRERDGMSILFISHDLAGRRGAVRSGRGDAGRIDRGAGPGRPDHVGPARPLHDRPAGVGADHRDAGLIMTSPAEPAPAPQRPDPILAVNDLG